MYLLLYFFAQLFIYIIMKAQKIYITWKFSNVKQLRKIQVLRLV
jgi:hypothetical protein